MADKKPRFSMQFGQPFAEQIINQAFKYPV